DELLLLQQQRGLLLAVRDRDGLDVEDQELDRLLDAPERIVGDPGQIAERLEVTCEQELQGAGEPAEPVVEVRDVHHSPVDGSVVNTVERHRFSCIPRMRASVIWSRGDGGVGDLRLHPARLRDRHRASAGSVSTAWATSMAAAMPAA